MSTSTITQHDVGSPHHPATELSTELPITGHTAHVTVYGPHRAFGELQPATVNWSAFGSLPAADARAYARLLELGASMAAELNDEYGFRTHD